LNQLPQITLLHGIHKHLRIVRIIHPFNQSVINKLKESANARWSATMRCWYMGKQSFDLHRFYMLAKGHAFIDYSAGLRRSELPDLRKQGVSFDKNVLFARGGKGKKDRATLLSGLLVIVLRYIQTFLGHDSSKTTEVYTDVTKKTLAKIKSPLDTILNDNKLANNK